MKLVPNILNHVANVIEKIDTIIVGNWEKRDERTRPKIEMCNVRRSKATTRYAVLKIEYKRRRRRRRRADGGRGVVLGDELRKRSLKAVKRVRRLTQSADRDAA